VWMRATRGATTSCLSTAGSHHADRGPLAPHGGELTTRGLLRPLSAGTCACTATALGFARSSSLKALTDAARGMPGGLGSFGTCELPYVLDPYKHT